jgi:hypothetical protein
MRWWWGPLCTRPTLLVGFFLLIDTLPHSDTLSWFRANQSLLFILKCCMHRGEAPNTNFIVFGLTWSGLEPTIYHTLKTEVQTDNHHHSFIQNWLPYCFSHQWTRCAVIHWSHLLSQSFYIWHIGYSPSHRKVCSTCNVSAKVHLVLSFIKKSSIK